MLVAIADDEKEILDQLSAIIEGAGHAVSTFRNGTDLETGLKRQTFDVVLLDWNMPGRTGLDVIEWANANLDAPPPFVLLTSRQEKTDIVRGLEAGAVDFIVKPESDQVIRARIEAAGRRTAASGPARRGEFGIYRLDRLDRTITVNGDPVHLTSKEFELADLFFQNLDRPLSRSYLFSKVWRSTAEIETRTLDMHISRIRSKLKLKPENGYVVRTVFGFGYRMDEYIEALEEG